METEFDFSGWATRADMKCSDGRIIMKDAFKHCDGLTVPLVWNHQHNEVENVLGHALLENRDGSIYAHGKFNDTESGQSAKMLVEHRDVTSLSIYANQLKQQGPNVLHGAIREVSLVLAGANPGAYIDMVVRHADNPEKEEEGIIFTGEDLSLAHAVDNAEAAKPEPKSVEKVEDPKPEEGETVGDVFNTLSEKQKNAVYAIVDAALEKQEPNEKDEEAPAVKHNAFDTETAQDKKVISHSDMQAVVSDARRYGSLRDSAIAHGITDIEYLFPEAKNVATTPDFIKRDTGWVARVMSGVHHTPFSRIKSMHADITGDDARARGYLKGHLKLEEVFTLMKRSTTPATIFKKQKLDRDDVVDITDFDVVAWLKSEMRVMLDEEIARAILVGDGRSPSSDDKIDELNIRPIWTDADLYTIKALVDPVAPAPGVSLDDAVAKGFIRAVVKAMKNYKGSGNLTLFTSEDELTNMLLLEDTIGHRLYESVDKLAMTMRLSSIVTAPIMENLTRDAGNGQTNTLMGIIVNLNDYYVGADKGGAINMFDDFDIDYNAQKYLIETRCSGALVKPYSAIAVEIVDPRRPPVIGE